MMADVMVESKVCQWVDKTVVKLVLWKDVKLVDSKAAKTVVYLENSSAVDLVVLSVGPMVVMTAVSSAEW